MNLDCLRLRNGAFLGKRYYELVELEKVPFLSTYVIEYSMRNKASTEWMWLGRWPS